MPSVCNRLFVGGLEEETDRVLEELIEAGTNVLTDILKHVYVAVKTVSDIVSKVVVVVLVKDVSGVSGLILNECGALSELLGGMSNTACTAYNVDLSLILFPTTWI